MPGAVKAADVVVGLLTENTTRLLTQAIRLVRSLRWFGGELASARVIVCGVGPLEASAQATLEALGAEIRTVTRFHPANPTANRHQLIAALDDVPQDILFIVDCDIIFVGDPLPYFLGDAFQAKLAPTPTVSDDVFERLFAHFGMTKPPRSRVAPLSGTPMIPYYNAGVMIIPKSIARTLAPAWRRYNQVLADNPELTAPCQRHMHQASLALALAETGVPVLDLPVEMNFQINATHVDAPGYAEIDPVLIHYHHLATDDGFLLPCPYPATQARIEMFHARMREEGFTPAESIPESRASRPIVVLGMHRSGTSVVAQLLTTLGIYAGRPDELTPADMFNPTGFWEHRAVVDLDSEILDVLGASWLDPLSADASRLSSEQRAGYLARAKKILEESLQQHGPFLLKDPRMALLFPFWREALENPVCVIVWRDPMAVAQSLVTRDKRPRLVSLAVWEHYTRTLLRDTEGLPRVVVSYDDLLADPQRVARELHATLTGFGVEGLTMPSAESIRLFVNEDFNRSGRAVRNEETLLDSGQSELLADLRSGAVLRNPVAPTPARSLELLAEFREREVDAVRRELLERDALLDAVFTSRSWRLGHRLTGLLRVLRAGESLSAEERWKRVKGK